MLWKVPLLSVVRSLLLLIVLLLPASAMAAEIKALVLPFDMHAASDISGLRRGIMEAVASSLEDNGVEAVGIEEIRRMMLEEKVAVFNEEAAFLLGERVKADFAVLGAVTKAGRTTNADWRILDLKDKSVKAFFYESSESDAELLRQIRAKAASMAAEMAAALRERPAQRTGTIDRVAVSGNRRVDTEAIAKKISSKEGGPFSSDTVKEDIRAIYATGYFDDVSASLGETASGRVLTFTVKELPFIRRIEFRGNSNIKEDRLSDAVTLKTNRVLDRVVMAENAEKIKALYEDEGYYLAKVNPAIESDGTDATVVFKIEEGPEVKVKRITIIGNKAFSGDDLKDLMNTEEVGFFTALTKSGKFNEYIYQNDLAIIMGHYFDNGYINADVLDSRVLLGEDKRWFYITIALAEGERHMIGKLDVSGDGDLLASKEELLEKLNLEGGEVFSRMKLAQGVEAIRDFYGDKGYAYAEVKPVTKVNPDKTIDITIDVKKYDLVYIEKVDINGNVRTRDKVIRREVELGEGDLYSSSELKRSRGNLKRLGYFEDVQITETRGSSSDRINLGVGVRERPTGSISLGLGYSSVDKVIGTASVSQSNFMGTGLKLDLSGTVSATSSRYVLGITEPWLFDRPISAGFDLYNTEREYPDFNLRKQGFDLRLGFPLTKRYTRAYITYKLEEVDITDVEAGASTLIKDQEGTSTESSVRLQVRRDTRNDAFFPSEGSVINLTTEFAGGPLGGTSYFIKYEADAVKFFPMPWNTVFSIHGAAGYVHGYDGKFPPIYERYFLGGINSVRGFETRSISPKDPATGDLIGGSSMVVVNAEYIFPLFPEQNIRGLVFFDAGNSYRGRDEVEAFRFKTSLGGGIRWFSPLGPIRIEVGFNLDPKEEESGSEWDFAIGTLF